MLEHKIGWGARVRLGGWVIALAALASLATAEAAGDAFAAKAGCASQTAACLRSLPVSAIVDNEDFSGCKPDIDGKVLTQPIVARPGGLAAVRRRQPADAVAGPAPAADRDQLRRRAPLRILGAGGLGKPAGPLVIPQAGPAPAR